VSYCTTQISFVLMYVAYVLFYIYEKLTWMDGWMDNISDDLK